MARALLLRWARTARHDRGNPGLEPLDSTEPSSDMGSRVPPSDKRAHGETARSTETIVAGGDLTALIYEASFASIVILAFSNFDTGHPSFALLAISSNLASSAPGTMATTLK